MRILCIGNTSEKTDAIVSDLARSDHTVNHGLVSDSEGIANFEKIFTKSGYYHTTSIDLSNSRLTEASNFVDSILILDQSIDEWSTVTEFYNTIEFGYNASKKVKWQNPQCKDDYAYWKNLIEKNKSFCIWPFIQMGFNTDGVRLCCRSTETISQTASLNSFHNTEYKMIRQKMLAGEILNPHCKTCYKLEASGTVSERQQQTIEWATRLKLKNTKDLENINYPVSIEILVDNQCNLQCRMCGPDFSTLIEKEYKELGLIASDKTYSVYFQDLNQILSLPRLEKLYISGGEPTANAKIYDFLNTCIEQGRTDFLLQINTNAHKVNKNFLNYVAHFSKIEFFVSIDAYEKANDYIRWGSKWKNTTENAKVLIDHNATVSFGVTLSLYGIFTLYDLLNYFDKNFPEQYVHIQYADNVYPFIIEYDEKTIKNLERIRNLNLYQNIDLLREFVDNVITRAKNSKLDKKQLAEFFEHNDMLDKSRNSKLVDYVPQLENYRKLL